jgi:hypothetical protein
MQSSQQSKKTRRKAKPWSAKSLAGLVGWRITRVLNQLTMRRQCSEKESSYAEQMDEKNRRLQQSRSFPAVREPI